MANILVYALHYEGAINKNSLGAVSEGAKLAAELGGEAHAILLGQSIPQDLAASLGDYGAKKVLVADGPEGLAQPLVDAMAAAISPQGGQAGGDYSYALFGGGLLGFEIGAGLAARLGAGVVMEVTNVRAENGELIAERPILGDSAISEIKYRSDVGIIIGRLNAFEIKQTGAGPAAANSAAPTSTSRAPTSSSPAGAASARPRAFSWPRTSPRRSAATAPSLPRARWSTPAGTPTPPRSGRRARR